MARLPLHRWRYSTRILFSGCDQATYQQDLVVHRTAGQDHEEVSGGLKVWHIYLGPQCRPDYGDLRFTDGNARDLAYYLWPGHDAETARATVRMEGADAAGAVTVHYGNPSATTTSDEDATFLLYVDFDDGVNPFTQGAAGVTFAGGFVSSATTLDPAGKSLRLAGGSAAKARYMPQVFGRGIQVDYYQYIPSNNPTASLGGVHLASPGGSSINGYQCVMDERTTNHDIQIRRDFLFGDSYVGTGALQTTALKSKWYKIRVTWAADGTITLSRCHAITGEVYDTASGTDTTYSSGYLGFCTYDNTYIDRVTVRAYSTTPPSFLRSSRGVNPAYAGIPWAYPADSTIRFVGAGTIQVLDDEKYFLAGEGLFSIETRVSSPIPVATVVGFNLGLHVNTASVTPKGVGSAALRPTRMLTPLAAEAGVGTPYVAPTPVQFDVWQYRFESLDISRSAQDALWRCDGQIDGLQAPLAYKSFAVRVPDHNGVLRTIFFGFVPGRDYVQAVAADKSTVQGFDAGFYLTRQYLPDGDLYYPAKFLWTPMNLIKYWLGEETTRAGSPSYWERVSGIMPYRIHNPSTYGHPYTPKDWNFQPKTTKIQAIQEVCEYSGMVFLVKWRTINGAMTPCAYLVHQDDIDDSYHGLDLPPMATFTHPDPCIANGIRATLQSDEKYNRIEVRSASPSGAWFHAVRETAALQAGEELPIEYLEERSDLPINANHGAWCIARANELYAYYTAYSYTYTMTLINRTDLELYQRCRFYGFGSIPDGDIMRIVAIRYNVRPTHTEVEITVTPDSRLSDLRRLQRSQAADSVSEVQTIAQGQINQLAAGEVGTVVGIDGAEAIVELERRADSSVRGRIV